MEIKKILNKLRKNVVVMEPIVISPPDNKMLKGENVLVIGASRGIGKVIAKRMSQAGANVIITGRKTGEIEATSKEINARGFLIADISNIDTHRSLFEEAASIMGGVDILINNAGVMSEHEGSGFFTVTEADWDFVFGTNMKALYFLCQTYAKLCIDNNISGNIINTSSITGIIPSATPYGLSKMGVNGITKGLSSYLASHGIRINAIAPGVVNDGMMSHFFAERDNMFRSDYPDNRAASAEEIANIALFLASKYSSHINGQVIACDGGRINKPS